jgi:hypothetical protein
MILFGFLKKNAINSVQRIPKKVNHFQPITPKTRVKSADGIRKGRPSLAMGHRVCFIILGYNFIRYSPKALETSTVFRVQASV